MGETREFDRLCAAVVLLETKPTPLRIGRNMEVEDIVRAGVDELDSLFDQDVGESSSKDD